MREVGHVKPYSKSSEQLKQFVFLRRTALPWFNDSRQRVLRTPISIFRRSFVIRHSEPREIKTLDAASNLMHGLLDYVLEQSKVVDPRGFTLAASRGLLKTMDQLSGLPGVDFDIKVEGDHIWMRVERLEALPPPPLSEAFRGLISASTSPTSAPPVLDERAIEHKLAVNASGKPPEQAQQEAAVFRSTVGKALAQYTLLWQAWSAGEKPRRQSIDLYGELFSLKQQLESEETAKPQELVWGMGIAAWRLRDEDGAVDYQYPLLTQAMELTVDETSLAITVRPRGVEPRFEFHAFSACQLMSAPDVEKTAKHALTQAGDRTPTHCTHSRRSLEHQCLEGKATKTAFQ